MVNAVPNIPVTVEEEEYWQTIGQRIEIVNQKECLFTLEENTWEAMDWVGA